MKGFAIELEDDIVEHIKRRYQLDNDAEVRLYLETIILDRFKYNGKTLRIIDSLDEIELQRRQGK